MVLDGLGLNKADFEAFMQSQPTYPQLEAWVVEQNGGPLDPAAVAVLNDSITGYEHDEATRKTILAASGIEDDGSITHAVHLNNLEDWQDFYAQEIAK